MASAPANADPKVLHSHRGMIAGMRAPWLLLLLGGRLRLSWTAPDLQLRGRMLAVRAGPVKSQTRHSQSVPRAHVRLSADAPTLTRPINANLGQALYAIASRTTEKTHIY